jgi:energy-coupling factor transport system permease protein
MNSRLDPYAKAHAGYVSPIDVQGRILIVLLASIAVLLLNHPASLGLLCVAGAIYLAETRRWRVQVIGYAMLCAFALLSMVCVELLGKALPMMRGRGMLALLVPFLRMTVSMQVVLALALTLELRSVVRLVHRFRLPRALCLPLLVAVRFLPGFIDDVKQVRDCLRLRGYGGGAVLRPRLWLLPLLFRAFHLTDDLATAAELKNIGYGRPTHAGSHVTRPMRFLLPVACAVLLLAGAIALEQRLPEPFPPRHSEAPARDHDKGDREAARGEKQP